MTEFKFACPVCGQHITAATSSGGDQIQCPTCFQKIVVPQAPTSGESKFILSASQVSKPRPVSNGLDSSTGPIRRPTAARIIPAVVFLILLGLAGAAAHHFRDRISKLFAGKMAGSKQQTSAVPRSIYAVPTNFTWTLDLTNARLPATTVAGSVYGMGFQCDKAVLQGGTLNLRSGMGGSLEALVSIRFFAQAGEELSGRSIEISSERLPPLPKVVVRWKNESTQGRSQSFNSGYALKVAFGEASSGLIPGKIYLALPDEEKSFVAGTFDAEIRKPAPPKPKRPKPTG